MIGRWMKQIEIGRNCVIYGDGEQRRDFTHVDDIVDALVLIMEMKAFGHEFEIGRGLAIKKWTFTIYALIAFMLIAF